MFVRVSRIILFALGALSLTAALAQTCNLTALSPADADRVHANYRDLVATPGPGQLQVLEVASQYLTPLQCASVRQVAFTSATVGEDEAGLGWVMTNSHNSTVHVSSLPNHASEHDLSRTRDEVRANIWLTTIETILHESVHSSVHLLNTQLMADAVNCTLGFFCDEASDPAQWSAAAVAQAEEVTDWMRLRGGAEAEWQRIHQSFVAAGWAQPYGSSPAELAEAGFMTEYGSRKPGEDMAEMVTLAVTRDVHHIEAISLPVTRPEGRDHACQALHASGGGISNRTAAVYTKLAFLRDLGLLSEEAFTNCVGPAGLTMPAGDGFHFSVDGDFSRTMNREMKASIVELAEPSGLYFQLEAEGSAVFNGETYDATVVLRLKLAPAGTDIGVASWPRGLYPFHSGGAATFELTLHDQPAGNFYADQGFVLVTTAGDTLEGAINLQRAWRPDTPFTTVPMAAEDLPTIYFRVSSSR